jgi:membrane-associated phospholipid phosphatase
MGTLLPFTPRKFMTTLRWRTERLLSTTRPSRGEWFTALFGVVFGITLFAITESDDAAEAVAINALLGIAVLTFLPILRHSRWALIRFLAVIAPTLPFYVFYKQCGLVLHQPVVEWRDAALTQAGNWLTAPLPLLGGVVLSEWLAFSYIAYAPIVVLSAAFLQWGRDRHARETERLIFAMCLVLAICYVFFILFPVRGPRLVDPTFQVGRLGEGVFSDIAVFNQQYGMLFGAAFPSAHVAGAIVALAPHWSRRTRWLLLPVVLTIPLATVYLGYHYIADGIAGAALGLAVCLAMGYFRRRQPSAVRALVQRSRPDAVG